MKRKLTIIAIILLIIAAIVGTLFIVARHKATKNGTTPPSFRQFLGIGTSVKPVKTVPTDTNGSDFTTTPDGTTTLPTGVSTTTPRGQNIPTGTSVFTNTGITPTGSTPADTTVPNGGAQGGNTTTGGTTTGGGTTGGSGTTTPPTTTVTAAPQCSDEDTTITFTPDEINRLNVLKNRFFAIAETLHTDADVATEATNYDAFKAKEAKIQELYTYCINSPVYTSAQATVVASQPYGAVVAGTNGPINYRVPTPFWHDLTKDNQALVNQGSNWQGIFSDPDSIFPERSIEHALRLNLW